MLMRTSLQNIVCKAEQDIVAINNNNIKNTIIIINVLIIDGNTVLYFIISKDSLFSKVSIAVALYRYFSLAHFVNASASQSVGYLEHIALH